MNALETKTTITEKPTKELSLKIVTNDDNMAICHFGKQLYDEDSENYSVVIDIMASILDVLKTKNVFQIDSFNEVIDTEIRCNTIKYITVLCDNEIPVASIRDIDFSDLDNLENNSTVEVYIKEKPDVYPSKFPEITDKEILNKIGKTKVGIDGKRVGIEVDVDKDLGFKIVGQNDINIDLGDVRSMLSEESNVSDSYMIVEPGIDQDRFLSVYYPPDNIEKVIIYDGKTREIITEITPEQMPFYNQNINK